MMQAGLVIRGAVLVLSAGLSVQTATACPKDAVARAVEKWITVFADNDPDTITALFPRTRCCGVLFHPPCAPIQLR